MDIEDAIVPCVNLGDGKVMLSAGLVEGIPSVTFALIEEGLYASGERIPNDVDIELDPFLSIRFNNKESVQSLLVCCEYLCKYYELKEALSSKDVQEES